MEGSNLSVQEIVNERMAQARQKNIIEKIIKVAQERGIHSQPSYNYYDESEHGNLWEFTCENLKLRYFVDHLWYSEVVAHWSEIHIFKATKDRSAREYEICSYISKEDWETLLDEWYDVSVRDSQAREAETEARQKQTKETDLRKRFGI